ncbi:hypothetical protein [Vibrio mediterranei]|uniref:Uncharacterized protein n=2 Tax=Vibrio TaxID=662 RepID=A0ABX5D8M7_9VIBR|nr:hypothetical protein [Vibrio mediterranei]MCG9661018.1 hypothetical protein [Vibrio mediterranei]MCG9663434.1 hypothetical protein [Vibrio mediterranei]PCD86263.1 hypothetical protein COR52_22635 [Vibrio mediterranei]PRQ65021.1 hypothetical protein COR51_24335 [Vibrio mediterranei]PTC04758.1 hypothetical protein C9980_12060 [Vibrio mediterranei]
MKITSKNVQLPPKTTSLIADKYQHLVGRNLDLLFSRCEVVFHNGFGDYEVSLKVHLETQSFYVLRTDLLLDNAIEDAFLSLYYKIEKYENKLAAKQFFRSKLQKILRFLSSGKARRSAKITY